MKFILQLKKILKKKVKYRRSDPKFSDRHFANSVDPGAVWSGTTLFAIPSQLFGHITLW